MTEITDLLCQHGWPAGMRVIIRAERPHPGAQLRLTDVDGNPITAFVTNTRRGQLADLELRHRRRARCEDRIRAPKATGLRNFPLHDFAQNRIWLAVITLAHALLAWAGPLALAGNPAQRWEPKRLRLRLFSIAGTLARWSRQTWLRLSRTAPWTPLLLSDLNSCHPSPPQFRTPADRWPPVPTTPEEPVPPGLEPAPARPRPSRRTQTAKSARRPGDPGPTPAVSNPVKDRG